MERLKEIDVEALILARHHEIDVVDDQYSPRQPSAAAKVLRN
jgi:hypothetical protein